MLALRVRGLFLLFAVLVSNAAAAQDVPVRRYRFEVQLAGAFGPDDRDRWANTSGMMEDSASFGESNMGPTVHFETAWDWSCDARRESTTAIDESDGVLVESVTVHIECVHESTRRRIARDVDCMEPEARRRERVLFTLGPRTRHRYDPMYIFLSCRVTRLSGAG
jgi:hypothetical protein